MKPSTELQRIKRDIRRNMLALRDAIPEEERCAASRRICRAILESTEYQQAMTLLLYRAVRSEVNLSALAEQATKDGKKVAFPRCVDKENMEARIPEDAAAFLLGAYGIPEPDPARSELLVPEEIDLVVCPCSAATEMGDRLGMGAGYYDRFLPLCAHAKVFCVAFAAQKAERLPTEDSDFTIQRVFFG